ncbi:hypothetical protein ACUNHX_17265 [Serratia sp. IR-2025]|uniref:hypothetical protein n=1 Tax=Serratia marcescens TaxID=615 RepID=UPI00066770F3|nr:hypothetical protein [Serratia marcescens]MBH2979485.1 hypothetical protein [Serratia marcescens]MDU0859347.1 hypothetical protein [Serratia marcescens]POX19381.1 hypothetical protein C3468_15530 [Serratia marcescens]QJU41364.1 hypothetical protein HMI62_19480 [Serratia marcescens]HAX9713537.1 hypothetical protein [Serratia marcescens]
MNTQQAIDVEKIVAGFTEQDNEAVYAEVEALDKKVPIHGFTAFISKYLPPDFDQEALALGADSTEYQELADAAIWDCLTALVERHRALEIYRRRHQFDEVA